MPLQARDRRPILLALGALLGILVAGCEDRPADPRFATPRATLDSLFDSYGVRDVPQELIRSRLRQRDRFELLDAELYRRCFADFQGEVDEGLAGFVFGSLVAGKDDLRIVVTDGTANVFPTSAEASPRPVVLREEDGEWKIVLRESVPPDVQRRLAEVYERSQELARRRGVPE